MTQARMRTEAEKKPELKRRMRIMIICVTVLFGSIFLYKAFMGLMISHFMANQSQVVTVSTMTVKKTPWQPRLIAAASMRAIQGVNVTTELAGMVQTIYFKPGAEVKAGTVLVQLNADNEIASLHALQANAKLAKITYDRDKSQFKIEGVSKQVVDNDAANLQSLNAQVEQQAAIVQKKTIVAPFTGRLGINLINLGQYVNPGDAITMLQTLDPIYADFYLPQQNVPQLKLGQKVVITIDTLSGREFNGKITTINPGVDVATRNVEVEATIENPKLDLSPGMFATATIDSGRPDTYITVPQTIVFYNPYGDIVYIVSEHGKDKDGKEKLIANQRFVKVGETRGDQVTILDGLKEGDTVVSSGQLKLKNGSQIAVNNDVVPPNNPAPALPNTHEG